MPSRNQMSPGRIALLLAIFVAPVFFVLAVLPTYIVDIRRLISFSAEFPLLGTSRHPPLSTWLAWLVWEIPGNGAWLAVSFQAVLNFIAIVFFWLIGKRFLTYHQRIMLAVVLVTSVVMTVWSVPGFSLNEDLAQIPLWAGSFYFFLRAQETSGSRWPGIGSWAGLGLFVGLSILTKYYAIMLVLALVLASFSTHVSRKIWRHNGPWIAVGVALLIVAPHLYWFYYHYQEMAFFWNKLAHADLSFTQRLLGLASAVLSPFLLALPGAGLLIVQVAKKRVPFAEIKNQPAFQTLGLFTGFLFVLTSMLALSGSAFNGRFQTPVTGFLVLILVAAIPEQTARRITPWILRVAAGFWLVIYGLAAGIYIFGPGHGVAQQDGRELVSKIRTDWTQRYKCGPAYVVGNQHDAGLVVAYFSRPLHLVSSETNNFDLRKSKPQIQKYGAILIGKDFGQLALRFPALFKAKTHLLTVKIPFLRNRKGRMSSFSYSFLAPDGCG